MTVCLSLQILNILPPCFGYLDAVHGLEQKEKPMLERSSPFHLCLLL